MNVAVLIGRLTKDPELRYTPKGTPMARFTLAVDKGLSKDKKAEMEANNQPTADFISIVVWGKAAENCATYLSKGRLTGVQGRIQSRSHETKDGSRRYITEVVATKVEFLEWGDRKQDDNYDDYNNIDNDFGIDGFIPVDDDNIPF